MNKIKEVFQRFWSTLPHELKVSSYLIVSYLLSDLASPLLGKLDGRVALGLANLVLVCGVEMRKRINSKNK